MYNKQERHAAIVFSGLGDHLCRFPWLLNSWQGRGIDTYVPEVGWYTLELFGTKMDRLHSGAQRLREEYDVLHGVGMSAGGSLVCNLDLVNPGLFDSVATACSRLSIGDPENFSLRTQKSASFAQSVRHLEVLKSEYSMSRLRHYLCIQTPEDELVPKETSYIQGANHAEIDLPFYLISRHVTAIGIAMLGNTVTDFLLQLDRSRS